MEVITDDLRHARSAIEAIARDFDPAACTGDDAVACVKELGIIRRLTDGMVAKAAERVEDTAAHAYGSDRSAAELTERLVGVSSGEAKRAIETAAKLEALPATAAAVRAGKLSMRQTDLIVATAADDPTVERDLLQAASQGMVPLRDACIAARARREDETERAARQHAKRSFRSWTNPEGMVEGHFTVTPEVGGAIKAVIDDGTRRKFRAARKTGVHESQDAYAADALAEAILGDPGQTKSGGYTTHVVIDHEALRRGHALPGETCEIPGVGPVNVGWVREILGVAFVTAIVRKGRDIATVAHVGRHVPAEVRTAMIVSGRECSIEGCSGREYLEIDHCEVDYADGGPTARWNLIWLCSIHHTRKPRAGASARPIPSPGSARSNLPPPPGPLHRAHQGRAQRTRPRGGQRLGARRPSAIAASGST